MDNTIPEQVTDPEGEKAACRLLSLPAKEIAMLRTEIARAKGNVVIFVHPYYENYHPPGRPVHRSKYKRARERIELFIASKSPGKPPIIVFEEKAYILNTTDTLERIAPGGKQYFVATIPDDGRPELTKANGSYMEEQEAWNYATKAFKYLGAKKFLLGGMYFDWDEDEPAGPIPDLGPDDDPYWGCVNDVFYYLKKDKDFDVQISSMTAPLTRKDVHPKPPRKKSP